VTRGGLLAGAACAAAVAIATAGCGGGSSAGGTSSSAATTSTRAATPAPAAGKPILDKCVGVPSGLGHAILASVVLDGAKLVHARAYRAAHDLPFYYVSASVQGTGAKNLLATWVTKNLSGRAPIYSVDANAALISQFGAATQVDEGLSVGSPGSTHSRRCVDGPNASPGTDAPVGSRGGAPAGQ